MGLPTSNQYVWDSVIEHAADARDGKHRPGGGKASGMSPSGLRPWARTLLKLVNHLCQRDNLPRRQKIAPRSIDDPFFFLPLCIPVVRYAIRELETECSSSLLGLFSGRAHRNARIFLTSRLLCVLTPAAQKNFTELFVKTGAEMASDCSEHLRQNMADRFFRPSPAARLLTILEYYPVLARLFSELCLDWVTFNRELFERLHRDRHRLIKCFSNSRFPAKRAFIRNAQYGIGDSHQNGRSVVILSLSYGDKVVYKPRECRGEFEWGRVLCRLKPQSVRPRHPKVLLGKGYGWVEFVRAERCRTIREVEAFYRRAGTQLCVAVLLRATDLHRGNVVAAGSHPVILDAETLWQVNEGTVHLMSLARTGLLPGRDMAGHSNESAFESIVQDLTDLRDKHRPRFGNRFPLAAEFIDRMTEGFCCAGGKLLTVPSVRRQLLRQLIEISRWPWRRVFWSTRYYETVRLSAIEPIHLTSGAARFRWLIEKCSREGLDENVVFAEAEALARFDIPYFTAASQFPESGVNLPKVSQLLEVGNEIQQYLKPLKDSSFQVASPTS